MGKDKDKLNDDELNREFNKYIPRIKGSVYNDILRSNGMVDAVVNEVYIYYRKKVKNKDDLKEVPYFLRNWILKSINSVLDENRRGIKFVKSSGIRNFYDRVKILVAEGYSEIEAKGMVILDESISRDRLAVSVDIDLDKYSQIKQNEGGEIVEQLIKMQTEKNNAEVLAACLKKWRSREPKNAKRNYDIFIDYYLREEKKNKIAKKYNLSPARITQITKRGLQYLTKCAKKKVEENPW